MKNQGRKPLPSNVKHLRGTAQACRMNINEPEYPTEELQPPHELGKEAQREWDRMLPILSQAKVISAGDIMAFTLYCENIQTWHEAHKQVRKYGSVVKGAMGYPVQSPYWIIERDVTRQIVNFLQEFGLTPSSRTRVSSSEKTPPKNKFASL